MLSHVQLFATPWTVVHQAPLSMEFSRQEYWSGLPFPSPGDFLSQELNPGLLHCRQILYHLIHQVTFWLKPALSLAPAHVHAVDWLEINTPPGMLTNPVGPYCSPALQRHFWPLFFLHFWDNYFIPFLFKPSKPPPSSLLLADDTASYFSEKIEAVKREFPQAPTTTSTHLHASVTEYSVSSPVTMDEPSVLRAKDSPSACMVDPILPALFQKIMPVVLCFFIFSFSFSAGFSPPT